MRGVGKTTTARILARAFNYEAPGFDKPSIEMPALGVHCQAIMDSRHVDVIEMDAASHTGIDDVREIIENARYRPVSARTKVYIIDEVHMLSKAAFNGLLKTLEEPPEHVKFLFATTEIDKVPVTVRSRCLRFDLKRIDAERLVAPSRQDLRAGGRRGRSRRAGADRARRRGLGARLRCRCSIRRSPTAAPAACASPTCAECWGSPTAAKSSNCSRSPCAARSPPALETTQRLYRAGADPAEMLLEISEFCHFVTRVKISEAALADPAYPRSSATAAAEIAKSPVDGRA